MAQAAGAIAVSGVTIRVDTKQIEKALAGFKDEE